MEILSFMNKQVSDYLPELHEMYNVQYELIRVDVPNKVARHSVVTLRCPLHREETTSRLNNFLAYKYGQYKIDSPSNVQVGRKGSQTVCTFPCARCRELKLSPVKPHILSDAGKAQRVANYLFSYLRRSFKVLHLGGDNYDVTCLTHQNTERHNRNFIKRNPGKVCLGCYIDINFQFALSKVVTQVGHSNFHYEVVNYPSQDTEVHVVNDGSRFKIVDLLSEGKY